MDAQLESETAKAETITPEDIRGLCNAWLAVDRDECTREEVKGWLRGLDHGEDGTQFMRRLTQRLRFGTAGLRARMGAGYDRMNVVTVTAATQGVFMHLVEDLGRAEAVSRGVVVGWDGRNNSEKFAIAVAAVFACAGVRVFLMARMTPTPIVAYATKFLHAACGVMITASHNPKHDNGYKLYWSDACQIRPPHDRKIEEAIQENETPWSDYSQLRSIQDVFRLEHATDCTDSIIESYLDHVTRDLCFRKSKQAAPLPIVYSAFHGVGAPYVSLLFERFGLPRYVPVECQCDPDPDFPTLTFPNPEEGEGALVESFRAAAQVGAHLVLANDPDADRVVVAEEVHGSWRIFTGNEIATLLAHWMWKNRPEPAGKYCMVASTVSSRILASMADAEGFEFREALTGFKWLSHTAMEMTNQGVKALLTYEEAIGFLCGMTLHDKDGVSASAVLAELAHEVYEQEFTLTGLLAELHTRYGVHLNHNGYLRCEPEVLVRVLDELRTLGLPSEVVTKDGIICPVLSVRDLTQGTDSAEVDGKARLPWDARSQFLTFRLSSGLSDEIPSNESSSLSGKPDCVVSLRGSGTESKVSRGITSSFGVTLNVYCPPVRSNSIPNSVVAQNKFLRGEGDWSRLSKNWCGSASILR